VTFRLTQWPPDPSRPAEWWNEFWSNEQQDFGVPSERVLGYAQEFLGETGSKSAVDVASGNGRYALPLAAMGYAVTAVESAPAAVARIRAAAGRSALPVKVVAGDFFQLASDPLAFDLVLSSGLLEEVPLDRHLPALEGYVGWTAPAGRNIVKYCLEIAGRGQLVPDGMVPEFYRRLGWRVLCVRENQNMKPSRAGIVLRTGLVVAERP
jgi:SAM-dependent methyltransferase